MKCEQPCKIHLSAECDCWAVRDRTVLIPKDAKEWPCKLCGEVEYIRPGPALSSIMPMRIDGSGDKDQYQAEQCKIDEAQFILCFMCAGNIEYAYRNPIKRERKK